MIKITYRQLASHEFQMAFQKVMNTQMSGKDGYLAKKIFAEAKKARERVADEFKKDVQEVFAKRDDKGEWTQESFEVAEGKQGEYEEAIKKFEERVVEIARPQLTMKNIKEVKLTPMDQLALEPVLDDSDAEVPEAPRAMRAV